MSRYDGYEDDIKHLKRKLRNTSNDAEREKLKKQIEILEKTKSILNVWKF